MDNIVSPSNLLALKCKLCINFFHRVSPICFNLFKHENVHSGVEIETRSVYTILKNK